MIVTCGEALIDMLPSQTVDGRSALVPVCGGAAHNSAVALGRLGVRAALVAGLSTDPFGTMLEAALHEAGVSTDLLVRSDRPTPLSVVHLTKGDATYTIYDEASAGRMLHESDLPALPAATKALLAGGISLAAEPCGSAFEALMHQVAQQAARKAIFYLDPNIRTGFISDETAYRARLARCVAMADIVKVSEEELHWLRAQPADWLAKGCALVIVTKGHRGATLHTPSGTLQATPPPVAVVDTIGAGDTFNAAVLCGLSEAGLLDRHALRTAGVDALRPVLSLANAAAAISVTRAGANPPLRSDINA